MTYSRFPAILLLLALAMPLAGQASPPATFSFSTTPVDPVSTAPTHAVFVTSSIPLEGSAPKVWREGSTLHVVASRFHCNIPCYPQPMAITADFEYLEPGNYTVVLTVELSGPIPGLDATEYGRFPLQVLRGPNFSLDPPRPREGEKTRLVIDLIDAHSPAGPPVRLRPGRIEVPIDQGGVISIPGGEAFEVEIDPLPAGTYDLDVLVNGGSRIRQQLEILPRAAILQEGRFEVAVSWTTADGQSGPGHLQQAPSRHSALYYFFAPNNWELMVKVLDGCAINGHYWVFTAAATDVAFTVLVTERATSRTFRVENPLGHPAAATTSTNSFPCS